MKSRGKDEGAVDICYGVIFDFAMVFVSCKEGLAWDDKGL